MAAGGATLPAASTATRGARIRYQPALDGLRGVFIVAVVAWDFGYAFGPGSVLCLDSLFALSGFLITALLIAEHRSKGRIDIKSFWSRRARRILPAMFLLVLGAAVYAIVWARPQELSGLRADSFATLLYYMNWHEITAGVSYFAQNAPKSFLKHTWSLAIEEQFYIVWPILVIALLKVRGGSLRVLFWTTAALTSASALWMGLLYARGADTNRLYFGTDTRAQSLLIGATAAILCARWGEVTSPTVRKVLYGVGIVGVLGTAVAWLGLDQAAAPMWNGGFLLAAGSATLIMVSVTQGSTVTVLGRSLSTRSLRWLGEISYGIYLWHWPIRIVVSSERTGLDGLSLLAIRVILTLAFGAASYYWLERPIRLGAIKGYAARLAAPAATVALVVVMVNVTSTSLPSVPSITASAAKPGTSVSELTPTEPTVAAAQAGPPDQVRVMFVGDSNGAIIGENFEDYHVGSEIVSTNQSRLGCGLSRVGNEIYHERRWGAISPNCQIWDEEWPGFLDLFDPDVVVMSFGAWDIYDRRLDGREITFGSPEWDEHERAEMQAAIDLLSSRGAHVIAVNVPCFRWLELDDGSLPPESDPTRVDRLNGLWRDVAARNPQVRLIDIFDWACPGGEYTDWHGDIYLRGDGQHFTHDALDVFNTMLRPHVIAAATASRYAQSAGS